MKKSMKYIVFTLVALILVSPAYADCVNPAGTPGQIIMNEDYNVPQYCDASDNWIAMTGGDPVLGGGDYIPNAVEFDGATWLKRGAGLSGVTDGKQFTVSLWLRFDASTDWVRIFSAPAASENSFSINRNGADAVEITAAITGLTNGFALRTGTNVTDGNWHHILASRDAATTSYHFYVNDIEIPGFAWNNDDITYDFTVSDWGVGADPENNWNPFTGALADMWIDFNTYIDLSIEANRRKFVDASGNPVYLGANGSLPTGTQPDVFLSGNTDTWHTNKSTGGGFTETGTLTAATTTPYTPITQIVPSGLIGHWRLDETAGTTAFDSSGNGFNATLSGGDISSFTINGTNKTAIDVNGGPYFQATSPAEFRNLTAMTFTAWVKMSDPTGNNNVFGISDLMKIRNTFNGTQVRFVANGWDGSEGVWNGGAYILDEWTHIAYTYDYSNPVGTDPILYVNGVQTPVGEAITPAGTLVAPTGGAFDIHEGARVSGNGPLKGGLDDVRLYNRVLTADEIQEIYQARDGIRYNTSHNTIEYFDSNQWVSMTQNWENVDVGPNYVGYPDLSCPNIGDVCSDGSVYAGLSPDGDVPMYTTPADAPGTYQWNDGTTNWVNTSLSDCSNSPPGGTGSCTTGESNTNLLVSLNGSGSPAPYQAAEYCAGLSAHGNDDWYLPSQNESYVMYTNVGAIGGFSTGVDYWTSSENSNNNARAFSYNNSSTGNRDKDDLYNIRCVRKADVEYGATGGLIGHWKLDETTGTTAYDATANGNDGTMNGSMDAANDSTIGAVAKSYDFDGVDDYIEVPFNAVFDAFPLTVSGWFKLNQLPTSTGLDAFIVHQDYSGTGYAYRLHVDNSDNSLTASVTDTGGTNHYAQSDAPLVADQWYHAVLVLDSNYDLRLYLNGTLQTDTTNTGSKQPADRPLRIGSDGSSDFIAGNIDDVRIYDRTLSPAEITKLYQMGAPFGSSTALPAGCPNIGDVCDDGTIYAGVNTNDSIERYVAAVDLGDYPWNNGNNADYVTTGLTDVWTGQANTNTLVITDSDSSDGIFQPHQAAQACYDLVAHGADDWYLMSPRDADMIYNSGDPIAGVETGIFYWTSTENSGDPTQAVRRDFAISFNNIIGKGTVYRVRCVRQGPAPRCANPYGREGTIMYNTDHDVLQYCDGARWIAVGKYE